jgi:Bacterial alpha-L-rhamnosidase 6 hairpin glycosidase domain/Bacterial alpha-L-rhamnosidase C-terminal domain
VKTLTLYLIFAALALSLAGTARAGTGSFTSSDPLLNQIWQSGNQTAADMLAPGGQTYDAIGDYCPTPAGMTVILDGTIRDRCPYIGDESVIDQTYNATDPRWGIQRNMLALFGAAQKNSGAIPSSPTRAGRVLFDYSGYWLIALHNYVLYSGDIAFANQQWRRVLRLMNGWYPSKLGADGLLHNDLGHSDYAFLRRHGDTVAYYNAEYVYVLKQAAELAGWLGYPGQQTGWLGRAQAVTRAFSAFWDSANGVFTDTTVDHLTHPEDGNSFAVIAGITSPDQATSALNYLWAHDTYSYGESISDVPTWDDPAWGYQSNMRVYPFIGYYELLARFQTGMDDSALDMIRREWGYMSQNGPGTDWELIGPFGGGPTDSRLGGGFDIGWSTGATPAITQYILGVRPTSPGYATYVVRPHPGKLEWAKGDVVTPRGLLHVAWKYGAVTTKTVTYTKKNGKKIKHVKSTTTTQLIVSSSFAK